MTNDGAIPVEVPSRYIKNKHVDFDGEIWAAIGGCLPIGGFLVKPPSLGVFSMLESYESKFIAQPEECTRFEFFRVLYINEHRQECLQEVMEWAYPDKGKGFDPADESTWQTFDWNVANFSDALNIVGSDELFIDVFAQIVMWFNLAFEGFAMIPGGGGSGEYWFGADTAGSMAAALGITSEKLLWQEPLCMVGHTLAALSKQNGKEGVARPKDKEDMKLKFEEARERVRQGKMHPWQLEDPEQWPPTQAQIKHNDQIQKHWENLVKERKKCR